MPIAAELESIRANTPFIDQLSHMKLNKYSVHDD